MRHKFKLLVYVLLGVLLLGALYLKLQPPALIRVGAGYTAKIVCSNIFIAGRDKDEVLKIDVQAPGHPLLKWMFIDVDPQQKLVRANLLGLFGNGLALYRPGTGCAALPDGDINHARTIQFEPQPIAEPSASLDWPAGSRPQTNPDLMQVIQNDQLAGPGMRAIVVIHDGRLVAQRYAKGFTEKTPLLGWSMTKTVTAALVGMQVDAGKLRLDQDHLWIKYAPNESRQKIRLADLLSMSSGLAFNENYGAVSDVTRMLFLEPDMAGFAEAQVLVRPPGTEWNYSTGTSVILADLWQRTAGDDALSFPRRHLFAPLGMHSAILETDARGTFAGGSYLYADAQDWARFSLMLMQDGQWQGQRLLTPDYVHWMRQPVAASHRVYGQGQLWLQGPFGDQYPGKAADFHFPTDSFWLQGHDGQSIAIIPSRHLIVLRMGLTPDALHYQPQLLLEKILAVLP